MLSVKVKSAPSCGMRSARTALSTRCALARQPRRSVFDEDDRELLAAVARDEVHAPREPAELGGERLEHPVAEGVAVACR